MRSSFMEMSGSSVIFSPVIGILGSSTIKAEATPRTRRTRVKTMRSPTDQERVFKKVLESFSLKNAYDALKKRSGANA